jgi:hypothetical protein
MDYFESYLSPSFRKSFQPFDSVFGCFKRSLNKRAAYCTAHKSLHACTTVLATGNVTTTVSKVRCVTHEKRGERVKEFST